MNNTTNIAIADNSLIIREGIMAVLNKIALPGVTISEIDELALLGEQIDKLKCDILIINPVNLGYTLPEYIINNNIKILALHTSLIDQNILNQYDGVISLLDSVDKIQEIVNQAINNNSKEEKKNELSAREKEIVVWVTKGMTNKEIADKLFISTHTVIAHRRNIANKLEIHSSSGLTIYAILNKLIDIESLPVK